jgi:hypothetical protein
MAKYPWGDAPFTMPSLFIGILIAAIIIGGALIRHGPEGAVTEFPASKDLYGVVAVTLGWVTMWYTFLGNQIAFKFATIDAAQKTTCALIADRGVINTLEQSVPFFLCLWMHALFVNPDTSSVVGWIYVIARYLYPIFYGMYGQFSNMVEYFSAQMNYACIAWFFWATLYKCSKDSDLHTDLTKTSPYLIPLVVLIACFSITIAFLFLSKPAATMIAKGVAWEAGYKPPLASQ